MTEKEKNLQFFGGDFDGNGAENKNTESRSSPCTRYSRNASDYDLHEKAGGLPLQTMTAPNIHHPSKRGREVCKQERKLTSRLKNVGPKRHATHQAGKKQLSSILPLLRKENPSEYCKRLPIPARLQ